MKIKLAIRNTILSLLLLLGSTQFSSGQVGILLLIFGDKASTEDLHLSIDGAFNLSNISNLSGGHTFLGANFGLGLHMNLGDHWQFNPELRPLSQKGVRNTFAIIDAPADISDPVNNWRLNYFEFPIMMRYRITPLISVAAGPQLSLLTSAKQISKGEYTNGLNAMIRMDAESHFRKVNFSFPLEMAYRIQLSRKESASKIRLDIFARYCHDFYPVFKDGRGFDDSRLSTWQLGISFPYILYH
ncbi:MAG: porin family protein [Draconibacterium sp.]